MYIFKISSLIIKKRLLIATLISTITIHNAPFAIRIFARHEVLIRKSVNLNIRISFYKGIKNEMNYKPSKYN